MLLFLPGSRERGGAYGSIGPPGQARALSLPAHLAYRPRLYRKGRSMAGPKEKSWSEGFGAGRNGKPITASPYKKGVMMVAWQDGWRAGAKAAEGAAG